MPPKAKPKFNNPSEFHFRLIRATDETDIKAIYALEIMCFPPSEAATLEQIRFRGIQAGAYFLLCFQGKKLVAFVNGTLVEKKKLSHDSMSNHQVYMVVFVFFYFFNSSFSSLPSPSLLPCPQFLLFHPASLLFNSPFHLHGSPTVITYAFIPSQSIRPFGDEVRSIEQCIHDFFFTFLFFFRLLYPFLFSPSFFLLPSSF